MTATTSAGEAVGRFQEAFAAQDLDAIMAAMTPDCVVVCWRYDWGHGHVRGVDVFTVRDVLVAEKRAYVKG